MNRSTLLTVLVVLLVAVAGCSDGGQVANGGNGNGGSGNGGGNGGTGNGGTGNGGMGGGNGGMGGGGQLETGEINFFEFDSPGRYVFDVEMAGEGSGQVTWDIQSIDGDQLTVTVDYAVGETEYSSTVSGTKETIQGQLMMSPAGPFMMLGIFSPMFGYYEGQQLSVGKQWSFNSGRGSMSFEITGTDSYAGVDCYASELRINESVMHEACFAPNLGLAAYTAFYDEETGSVDMRMELVEYSPN